MKIYNYKDNDSKWMISIASIIQSPAKAWGYSKKEELMDNEKYHSSTWLLNYILNFAPYFTENKIKLDKDTFVNYCGHGDTIGVELIVNNGYAVITEEEDCYLVELNLEKIENTFGFKISELIDAINETKKEGYNPFAK